MALLGFVWAECSPSGIMSRHPVLLLWCLGLLFSKTVTQVLAPCRAPAPAAWRVVRGEERRMGFGMGFGMALGLLPNGEGKRVRGEEMRMGLGTGFGMGPIALWGRGLRRGADCTGHMYPRT